MTTQIDPRDADQTDLDRREDDGGRVGSTRPDEEARAYKAALDNWSNEGGFLSPDDD